MYRAVTFAERLRLHIGTRHLGASEEGGTQQTDRRCEAYRPHTPTRGFEVRPSSACAHAALCHTALCGEMASTTLRRTRTGLRTLVAFAVMTYATGRFPSSREPDAAVREPFL